MKLKNILIVVNDIERAKKFYRDLFGLETVLDNDEEVLPGSVRPGDSTG